MCLVFTYLILGKKGDKRICYASWLKHQWPSSSSIYLQWKQQIKARRRNVDSYIFTAVLADGLWTDEAPQVSAWVLSASMYCWEHFSWKLVLVLSRHWLLPGLGPLGGLCWKGSEMGVWISDRTSSSCQALQKLPLGDICWGATKPEQLHVEHGAALDLDCSNWKSSSEQHIPASLLPHHHVETFQVLKADQDLMLYSMWAKAMALFSCSFCGKSPLVFPGAGEERDFFSLPHSPLQRVSRSGCTWLCCGCLAECVVDGLSPAALL